MPSPAATVRNRTMASRPAAHEACPASRPARLRTHLLARPCAPLRAALFAPACSFFTICSEWRDAAHRAQRALWLLANVRRAQSAARICCTPKGSCQQCPYLDSVQPVVVQAHAQEDPAGGAPASEQRNSETNTAMNTQRQWWRRLWQQQARTAAGAAADAVSPASTRDRRSRDQQARACPGT